MGRGGRTIKQYDLNDNYIQTFKSLSEAAHILKIKVSSISKCVSGRTNTAYGFKFIGDRVMVKPDVDSVDYLKQFITTELMYIKAFVKRFNLHEIYCYNEEQVNAMCQALAEINFEYDWYYNLKNNVYIIECRRVENVSSV